MLLFRVVVSFASFLGLWLNIKRRSGLKHEAEKQGGLLTALSG